MSIEMEKESIYTMQILFDGRQDIRMRSKAFSNCGRDVIEQNFVKDSDGDYVVNEKSVLQQEEDGSFTLVRFEKGFLRKTYYRDAVIKFEFYKKEPSLMIYCFGYKTEIDYIGLFTNLEFLINEYLHVNNIQIRYVLLSDEPFKLFC